MFLTREQVCTNFGGEQPDVAKAPKNKPQCGCQPQNRGILPPKMDGLFHGKTNLKFLESLEGSWESWDWKTGDVFNKTGDGEIRNSCCK